ncbi:hypothetical protein [Massilia genomosp. 1]|nr:hypothetical protein [Massilia genomosp. 1]
MPTSVPGTNAKRELAAGCGRDEMRRREIAAHFLFFGTTVQNSLK